MSDSKKTDVRFSNVDQHDSPDALIQHQDLLNLNPYIQRQKQKSFELLCLKPGAKILDVGCGNGDDVIKMANLMEHQGEVIGIANSNSMIAEAQKRHKVSSPSVSFQYGDVYELPFDDNAFDGARADRVFMHLENREQALSEMIRVTKPNGYIVINEPDLSSFIFDAPDIEMNEKYIDYLASTVKHPWTGRQLSRIFKGAGLTDVTISAITCLFLEAQAAIEIFVVEKMLIEMVQKKLVAQEKADGWFTSLRQAGKENRFFAMANQFAVCGTVPSDA